LKKEKKPLEKKKKISFYREKWPKEFPKTGDIFSLEKI
jgi:hypothetical protein